jgi:hypothetical protein
MVSLVIGRRVGHVAGGIDIVIADHLKRRVHMQTTQAIARRFNLCRQAVCLHANRPDNGAGCDLLPVFKHDAIGINPLNFSIDPPFNTELCGPGR